MRASSTSSPAFAAPIGTSFLPCSPFRRSVSTARPRPSLRLHRRSVLHKYATVSRRAACACASDTPASPPVLTTLTNAFPVWVLLSATAALIHPPTFLWFRSDLIPPTLALIMLGMGLTTPPRALTTLLATPRKLLIGVVAQYTVMPLLATAFARMLALPSPMAAGLILVGVCPGGAASNVVCLLARADVPLSVLLTLSSTLLSVAMIPVLMTILAGALVPVNPTALLVSTAQVVLLPLLLGVALQRTFPRAVRAVHTLLPLVSVLGVSAICAGVVAASASSLRTLSPTLVLAIASMHALGGALGFFIARITRLNSRESRTVSVEVMMQNSSLAVSLAAAHFANPLTAVPGAISATIHSVLGSLLAGAWRILDARKQQVAPSRFSAESTPDVDALVTKPKL